MNTTDQVKQCGTVQEALLVLAAAIDALAAPPADPFEQPLVWTTGIRTAAETRELEALANIVEATTTRDNRSQIIDGEVVVKPVSHERQLERAAFAMDSRLHEFWGDSLSAKDFHDAYVKGGPRWLYYTDRECVMQMPLSYRQILVADILLDSPSEADEIGRDILKFDESVPQGEAVEQQRAAREFGPAYKG